MLAPIVLAVISSAPPSAGAVPPPPATYHRDIAPVLRAYCVGCHNPSKKKGDLLLDSFAHLQEGGANGAVLVAGKPDDSALVTLGEGTAEPVMPPKGNPAPSPDELKLLRRWVAEGAVEGAVVPATSSASAKLPDIRPSKAPVAAVNDLAVSPDGKLLSIAGHQSVRLVDLAKSQVVREWKGLAGSITVTAFGDGGRVLMAAGGKPGRFGQAWVWNVADGSLVRSVKGHDDSLHAAALSPDGRQLATAGYDKVVRLWDMRTGAETRLLKGHNDAVYGLAFRPDGNVLASISGDRTLKLWNPATGERLDTLVDSTKELFAVAWAPAGDNLFAVGTDNRLRRWRISSSAKEGTNRLLDSKFAHQSPIISLSIAPAGDRLLTAAEDGSVKIWTTAPLAETALVDERPSWPTALAWAGPRVLVGDFAGGLLAYDVAAPEPAGRKGRPFKPMPAPVPKPDVASVVPRGLERGAVQRLRIFGTNLQDAQAKIEPATFKATIVADPAPMPGRLTIDVTAPADMKLSQATLTLTSPGGAAAPVKLPVDDGPQLELPPAAIIAPPSAGKPVGYWGLLGKLGAADTLPVHLAVGDVVVCELAAATVGSKLAPVMQVFDPSARLMAAATAADGADPWLLIGARQAGVHRIRIADTQLAGSPDHFYRLTLHRSAYVTGVYPPWLPPGEKSVVALSGANLRQGTTAPVAMSGSDDATLDLDRAAFRQRPGLRVRAGQLGQILEQEPNDNTASATPLPLGGSAVGRIGRPGDRDLYRFHAKAGEPWIIETEAARIGAPVDTRLDLLHPDGKPVERLWLQATRDSNIEFRGFNSTGLEVRCLHWQEMELNEYMYLSGEVGRLFRAPQGPDSGFNFYAVGGKRLPYFDTTATAHALGDPVYIVTPLPPGTKTVPNGLPVFRLNYANDDASDGLLGRDSRLTFAAPADGDYLLAVTDTHGQGGDGHAYRVLTRRPAPGFDVKLVGVNPSVSSGSGRSLTFVANRVDGFDGAIDVEVDGLPHGFTIAQPLRIEAGHVDARSVLFCADDAPAPRPESWSRVTLRAAAAVDGATVVHEVALSATPAPPDERSGKRLPASKMKPAGDLSKITMGPKPKLSVRLAPHDVTLEPGGQATVEVTIDRRDLKERVSISIDNLPHGVIVNDIGLNGILIPPGQATRQVVLVARPWVAAQDRPFFANAAVDGNQASPAVMLHVRSAPQAALASPGTGRR